MMVGKFICQIPRAVSHASGCFFNIALSETFLIGRFTILTCYFACVRYVLLCYQVL